MESFGERLKRLREEKGLTQEALGKLLSVTQQAIGYYENNRNEPNRGSIEILTRLFGVSSNYLLCIPELATYPYDIQEIFQEPDSGRALIKWHAWKRKFNIPLDDYIKGEEMIIAHYGDLPAATNDDEVAHGPNTPGTGALSKITYSEATGAPRRKLKIE
jgi:DNA-binding XRE family transcriptional regulator